MKWANQIECDSPSNRIDTIERTATVKSGCVDMALLKNVDLVANKTVKIYNSIQASLVLLPSGLYTVLYTCLCINICIAIELHRSVQMS